MRVLARRSMPVIVDREVINIVAGQVTPDLPDDIALALIRGMAALRIPDEATNASEASTSTSASVATVPSVASVATVPAAPAKPAKSNKPRK